jgi:hypothetical protein
MHDILLFVIAYQNFMKNFSLYSFQIMKKLKILLHESMVTAFKLLLV